MDISRILLPENEQELSLYDNQAPEDVDLYVVGL